MTDDHGLGLVCRRVIKRRLRQGAEWHILKRAVAQDRRSFQVRLAELWRDRAEPSPAQLGGGLLRFDLDRPLPTGGKEFIGALRSLIDLGAFRQFKGVD